MVGPLVGLLVDPSVRNAFVKNAKSVGKSSFSDASIVSVSERNIVHPLVHQSFGLYIHPSIS